MNVRILSCVALALAALALTGCQTGGKHACGDTCGATKCAGCHKTMTAGDCMMKCSGCGAMMKCGDMSCKCNKCGAEMKCSEACGQKACCNKDAKACCAKDGKSCCKDGQACTMKCKCGGEMTCNMNCSKCGKPMKCTNMCATCAAK